MCQKTAFIRLAIEPDCAVTYRKLLRVSAPGACRVASDSSWDVRLTAAAAAAAAGRVTVTSTPALPHRLASRPHRTTAPRPGQRSLTAPFLSYDFENLYSP